MISSEPEVYRYAKLVLFALLEGPSILISIYILYQFLRHRQYRSRLNNHSIIGLICISLIETASELPIALNYLRLGYVSTNEIWFLSILDLVQFFSSNNKFNFNDLDFN